MNKDTVSVVIPTFGDDPMWDRYALRAEQSAHDQRKGTCRVIRAHDTTLARARNMGAVQASSEWVIFLDADDTLDHGYIKAMMDAREQVGRRKWIFRPATLGIVDGVRDDHPVMIPRRDLFEANCIVIGAMVRRDEFLKVGGFSELARLEDWELFLKLYIQENQVVDVPEAVYEVAVRPDSRNQGDSLHGEIYSEIRRKYAPYRYLHSDQE